MGKSLAAELLRRRGLPLIDTDVLARQVVEPGRPAWAEIRAAFGEQVFAPDGGILRRELARRVFAEVSARQKLEGIMHPRIHALWRQRVAELRAGGCVCGVVVIPLLFETGTQSCFDSTLCVACSDATQQERLRARGWTAEEIQQRNAAQWPIRRKMDLADFVLWNEGPVEVLDAQLAHLLPLPADGH
jgi:dephospho-CoA kinase